MNKRLRFLFFTGLFFYTAIVFGQQQKDSISEDKIKSCFKITAYVYTGFEWEQKIGKNSTIELFAGMAFRKQSDKIWDSKASTIIEPDTYAEYRNYYNYFKRTATHKKTKNNSANFLFGRIETYYPVKNQNFFNLLFVQGWGAQRTLWKGLSINCHLGIIEHFYYDAPPAGGFNYLKIEPMATFSFLYSF